MMKKLTLIFILTFAIQLKGICQHNNLRLDQLKSLLQQTLDSLIHESGAPGATFCLILPSGEKISIASGYADIESKTKMPANAMMFTGSVGKTLVAATVLKLVEQKKLNLDVLAKEFFAGEQWFFKIPNAEEVTVRMLLNHTSGIPEYVYNRKIWETLKANPDKTWTGEERLYYCTLEPAVNAPGQGWSYADANYIVLGLIIEKITGKSFYQLAEEWFINPLKLENTKPAIYRKIKGLVQGYTGLTEEMLLPEKMVKNGKYAFNPQVEWTGGGFTTNVQDLAKWAKALYGGDVLSKEMHNEMLTPSIHPTTLAENAGYGLGAFIGKTNSIRYYGHTGFVPGYRAVMEYIPDYGIALAMQVNSDKFPSGKHPILDLNTLKSKIIQYIDKNTLKP